LLVNCQELNGHFMAIFSRYHGFIGDCHFTSLVSLIGYQDMAMILKELLENVRTVVSKLSIIIVWLSLAFFL
jgi:Cytoplasmic Fragile-X interacting family